MKMNLRQRIKKYIHKSKRFQYFSISVVFLLFLIATPNAFIVFNFIGYDAVIPNQDNSYTNLENNVANTTTAHVKGPINPTAPNDLTKYLTGNFTDSDGDGMTDVAENKYGFNASDPLSFPQEPEYVNTSINTSITTPIPGSGINATFTNETNAITIHWENPSNGGSYSLELFNNGQQLYWGGHGVDYAIVSYIEFNLTGTEVLIGQFHEYNSSGQWVGNFSEFPIDLSLIDVTGSALGASTNKISYTFMDFSVENETTYREFLKRVWPIMYDRLGAPAESFNCLIKDVGTEGYFMIVQDGREFLSDESFIPRLIVHEFVHAWKGSYTITTDENWDYNNSLSGFEEGSAEGMAFEIIHEYVRSYPNDSASLQLLNGRPYQYWSSHTTYYDSIKYNRWTGAGDFWTHPGGVYGRYSIAATTFQILIKKDPDFYKKMMQEYYEKINTNASWRSNRADILDIWAEIIPQINGLETKLYLDSIPVFQGHKLDEGGYVLNVIRPYGTAGDQQFAVSYVPNDGQVYWGILKTKISDYNLPSWVKYDPGNDSYYYIDTQNETFTVEVFTDNQLILSFENRTKYDRRPDGTATGFGWVMLYDLGMENFPVGLYREKITFTNYIPYDTGATEDFYFFGYDGFMQDRDTEYIIMIGIDGILEGNITIMIDSLSYTQPITRGAAIFRSNQWSFDMEGEFSISITDTEGNNHTYYRTLLEAGTYWGYFQHQFIITDRNFNGVEDQYEISPIISLINPTNNSIHPSGTTIDLSFTDKNGISHVLYNWDGAVNATLASPYDLILPVDAGQHILRVYAQDTAGNWAYRKFVFTTDDIKPNITLISPANDTSQASGTSITANVTDANTLQQVRYSWDGNTNTTLLLSNSSLEFTTSLPRPDGVHTLKVYAQDTAGNWASVTYIFTTVPPAEKFPLAITIIVIISIAGGIGIVTVTAVLLRKRKL